METKIEGHHFLIAILIAWVAIVLFQQNILGLPALVSNLTKTVTGALSPITGSINVGALTGTSGQ